MQNEMRDRLIELIRKAETEVSFSTSGGESVTKVKRKIVERYEAAELADHLLADGWIRLPCKVGDYIYYPWHYDANSGVAILEVNKIVINGETLVFILDPESDMPMPCWFSMDDFGKTVFLTKEEAEAHLPQPPKGE